MFQTNIKPVQVFPDLATKLQISSAVIISFGNEDGKVRLEWRLLSDNNQILRQEKAVLIGSDYTNWTDDSYLLDKMCELLNLTRVD